MTGNSDVTLRPKDGAVLSPSYGESTGSFEARSSIGESGALLGSDFDVEGEIDDAMVEAQGEDQVTLFVWGLVMVASISGLMFGIDTAIISGTLVAIGTDISPGPLTNHQKEVITSSTTVGALVGGAAAGIISDIVGRKPVIAAANVVFILGAALQAIAGSVFTMVVGRVVVGLGVGLAACIIPLYIGELSPAKLRGRLVTINCVAITFGQVVAYGIGAGFQYVPNGWRWMVGLSAVPAALQLACMSTFLPESPRILMKNGKQSEAIDVLSKIYARATPSQIEAKANLLKAGVKQSIKIMESTTFQQRFESIFTVGYHRRALIVGAGLQAFQQLCGFNSLMYYSSTLFAAIGFRNSTAVSSVVAVVNFACTLVSLRVVDPVGRRKTMLYSTPGMIVSLLLASVFFWRLTQDTNHRLETGVLYDKSLSLIVVIVIVAFVIFYAIGLGNIPWAQGELFKLEVRGIGTSLSTATNWAGNLVISATFLSLMEAITPSGAFALYSLACIFGWLFCYFCQPETSGLSLEELFLIFENDFGVEKSLAMRKEKIDQELKSGAV